MLICTCDLSREHQKSEQPESCNEYGTNNSVLYVPQNNNISVTSTNHHTCVSMLSSISPWASTKTDKSTKICIQEHFIPGKSSESLKPECWRIGHSLPDADHEASSQSLSLHRVAPGSPAVCPAPAKVWNLGKTIQLCQHPGCNSCSCTGQKS